MYVWIATICMYVWCMNIVRGIKDKENEMLDMMCNYNNYEGTDTNHPDKCRKIVEAPQKKMMHSCTVM